MKTIQTRFPPQCLHASTSPPEPRSQRVGITTNTTDHCYPAGLVRLTSHTQVCHLHIGQAGTQLGNSAWELYVSAMITQRTTPCSRIQC
jgi:hypothetical protein